MENGSLIKHLCTQHTSLTEEDVHIIQEKSTMLQTLADMSQAHVFIDCIVAEQKAVVVAEAVPSTAFSIYKKHLVGKMIYKAFEPAVFRSYQTGESIMSHRAVTHEGQHVSQNVMPFRNGSNKIIGLFISEKDITAQVQHELELETLTKTTEEISKTFWDIVSNEPSIPDVLEDGLMFLNRTGEILYANNYAISLLEHHHSGPYPFDYKSKKVYDALPFISENSLLQSELSEEEEEFEGRVYCKRIINLRSNGGQEKVLLYLRDISDLREKERQLVVKSAVIKEIHHRVKNNLQTVASLLRLQLRRGVPEEAKVLYQESLNRILSIATVHDYLSYNGLEKVDIKEIIQKVAKMLVFQAEIEEEPIKLELSLDSIVLPSSHAVSLALIFTEILQNSLKHGYSEQNGGVIQVFLKMEQSKVTLRVIDDGSGIKENERKEQLGLEIVKNLTEFDLGGSFAIYPSQGKGTTANVEFILEEEGFDE
ncbi:sensor histidine kinase [Fictibacillus fluitans]|uniref:histidine kinase n=1 Tax=Fictibacillus fluitans TaxID=3058422 RepID=A0ABT8I0Z2_9BACL|nr:sensor histidine kinase [Fictibacillus sp. NE201]MDN4526639.1 sensor histidine kinase [Fictibacillus sp. NE201]